MRTIILALLASAVALPALADEAPIKLKKAPGVEAVQDNCQTCHSLSYIPMNSPFLKPAQWDAEVGKMVKVMGAPISAQDVKTITDYLKANYGG